MNTFVSGYSVDHVMGLTSENIDKQLAFARQLEDRCAEQGKTLPHHLALMRDQLWAEKMRREGHSP